MLDIIARFCLSLIDTEDKYMDFLFHRWAQFFIHPLMIRDAIDREVEAVDSGK